MVTQTRDGLKFTDEQAQIINTPMEPGGLKKVIAAAGTGKTFVLENLAAINPWVKFLYLAFNRSVKDEARGRFPMNVTCHTINSLAFQRVGRAYKDGGGINSDVGCRVLAIELSVKLPVAASVKMTLDNFLNSADETLRVEHVRLHSRSGLSGAVDIERVMLMAYRAWTIMLAGKHEYLKMTHSGVLKLFQLQVLIEQIRLPFDCILCDEAQDINPVQKSIIMEQQKMGAQVIFVGDPLQQIYSWRGAINAMQDLECEEMHLTQSFRFSKRIAWIANKTMGVWGLMKHPVVGGSSLDDAIYGRVIPADQIVGGLKPTQAVLTRTNMQAFIQMLALVEEGEMVGFNGDMDICSAIILDIYNLRYGDLSQISRRGKLRSCRCMADLEELCEVDPELNSLNGVVDHFKAETRDVIDRLRTCLVRDPKYARVVVSTVHRYKGLEADCVTLGDDFLPMVGDKKEVLPIRTHPRELASDVINQEELHILYVALTRARRRLAVSKPVTDLLDLLKENPNPPFVIPKRNESPVGSKNSPSNRRAAPPPPQ